MAQGHCFIKIESVQGEANEPEHVGEIEVSAWSWGVASQPGTAQLRNAHADVRELSFVHLVDRASPALLAACANNKLLRTAELTMRRAGGKSQKYLRIALKNVKVTSVSLDHGAEQLVPAERVTLSFETVDYDYVPQSSSGSDRSGASTFHWQANRG